MLNWENIQFGKTSGSNATDMILKTIYLILYARFVNPSMNICIVTDADSPNNNEVRKM